MRNKRKAVFIALIVGSIAFIALSLFLFLFSFSPGGFDFLFFLASAGLAFCSSLTFAIGIICRKKRNREHKKGIIFLAIGIPFVIYGGAAAIISAINAFYFDNNIPLLLSIIATCDGIALIIIGGLQFFRNKNQAHLPSDDNLAKKRKITFVALVIGGIAISLLGFFLLLLWFGMEEFPKLPLVITALILIPCGFLTVAAGVICRKKRNRKCKLGIILCGIGISLGLYGIVLAPYFLLIVIWSYNFIEFIIPLVLSTVGLLGGISLIVIGGKLFLRNRNPSPLQNNDVLPESDTITDID